MISRKRAISIAAIALATVFFASAGYAAGIDPNNPNVTNSQVDADGQRDIQSRFDECKQLQTSLPMNATQQQIKQEYLPDHLQLHGGAPGAGARSVTTITISPDQHLLNNTGYRSLPG